MKKILSIIILFLIFSFKFVSAAVINISYEYPWEGAGNLVELVDSFYRIALGLVGAAALGVLIYGALLWIFSGTVTSKQEAGEWISGALWGLILLLGAFLIFYTINPDLIELRGL